MNIKKIQRNKKFKKNLIQIWYKLMKPLADLIDNIDDKKYKKVRKKAKRLTDEEAIDIVIKRIVKRIKKYGRLDEEIAICTWSEETYNPNIFEFTRRINNNDPDRILNEWRYIHQNYTNPDIDYIAKLTDLLEQKLRKIDGIKVEYYIEKYLGNWRYNDYVKTLKISLEE